MKVSLIHLLTCQSSSVTMRLPTLADFCMIAVCMSGSWLSDLISSMLKGSPNITHICRWPPLLTTIWPQDIVSSSSKIWVTTRTLLYLEHFSCKISFHTSKMITLLALSWSHWFPQDSTLCHMSQLEMCMTHPQSTVSTTRSIQLL